MDLVGVYDDGSPKGRPAVILQLVTPTGAVAPFLVESVQTPQGPGFRALWLVAPGDYTIAFVHEKLPEQDQKVTIAPKEAKTVDQTFKAGGAS